MTNESVSENSDIRRKAVGPPSCRVRGRRRKISRARDYCVVDGPPRGGGMDRKVRSLHRLKRLLQLYDTVKRD